MNKLLIIGLAGVTLAGCSLFNSGSAPAPAPAQHAVEHARAPAMDSSFSPSEIQGIQQKLIDSGDYHGAVDGKWGPATDAAIRSYQHSHNLTVTGRLDDETRDALNNNSPKTP